MVSRARHALEQLLHSGALHQQYGTYLDELRVAPFYGQAAVPHGLAAAEKQLRTWCRLHYVSLTSALAVEAAVRSLLTLSDEQLQFVNIHQYAPYPHHPRLANGHVVYVLNSAAPGRQAGESVFEPEGELGLKAISLSWDDTQPKATVELGLVLPARVLEKRDLLKYGYAVLQVRPTGQATYQTVVPGRGEPTDGFLARTLTDERPLLRGLHSSGVDLKGVLGQPTDSDPNEYLATHLPQLR